LKKDSDDDESDDFSDDDSDEEEVDLKALLTKAKN